MSQFIHHTLILLEDAGMSTRYPDIRHITLEPDGKSTAHHYSCTMLGKRVNIEQNQPMKFMMLFALLDFHIDTTYPGMEGKNYQEKYKNLPTKGDFDLILSQLFRMAKIFRNALIHNFSSFDISDGYVSVDYTHGKNRYAIKLTWEAWTNLHTAIIMYIKGDMGRGNYFMGIMRSIYADIIAGIESFSDEFSKALKQSSGAINLKPRVRQVLLSPPYETVNRMFRIAIPEPRLSEWEGLDFYIVRNDVEFLIPREALDEKLSIAEQDLIVNWKREGRFPHLNLP